MLFNNQYVPNFATFAGQEVSSFWGFNTDEPFEKRLDALAHPGGAGEVVSTAERTVRG